MPVTWRGAVIFSQTSEPTLIVMDYDFQRVKHDTWIADIREWNRVDQYSFAQVIIDTLRELDYGRGRIGIEIDLPDAVGLLSVPEYKMLVDAFGEDNLVDVTRLVDREVMVIKDQAEIEFSRQAAAIADIGIQVIVSAYSRGHAVDHGGGVGAVRHGYGVCVCGAAVVVRACPADDPPARVRHCAAQGDGLSRVVLPGSTAR